MTLGELYSDIAQSAQETQHIAAVNWRRLSEAFWGADLEMAAVWALVLAVLFVFFSALDAAKKRGAIWGAKAQIGRDFDRQEPTPTYKNPEA